MGPPSAAGEVVLVRFPFSDLSQSKVRPALVLAAAGRGDLILCQITSSPYGDARAVSLSDDDFESGGLRMDSFSRPTKLFTASSALVVGHAGVLRPAALRRVIDSAVSLLRQSEDQK